jgi:hypothetical protein
MEQRLLPEVAAPALLGPVGRRHRHRPGPHALPSLADHGMRSSQIRIGRGKNRADEGGAGARLKSPPRAGAREHRPTPPPPPRVRDQGGSPSPLPPRAGVTTGTAPATAAAHRRRACPTAIAAMTHEKEGEGGESIRARASHDLALEKRGGEACGQSQERGEKLAAGGLAPNLGIDIKQVRLALAGLAGQNWPISKTP